MKTNKLSLALLLVLAPLVSQCEGVFSGGGFGEGGGFTGGSGAKKNNGDGASADGGGLKSGGFDPSKSGTRGDLSDLQGCVSNAIATINVVLVIDNSGSQENTDPTRIRRTAAQALAKKLSEFSVAGAKTTVKLSTLSFNKTAYPASTTGQNWVDFDQAGSLNIALQHIEAATGSLQDGTFFLPALNMAGTFLAQTQASSTNKSQRNFIVFSTDGFGGNKEDPNERVSVINGLVAQYGVAMVMVIAGSDISATDEVRMQAYVLPTVNAANPGHVGRYFRAATGSELNPAFEQIFNVLTRCK